MPKRSKSLKNHNRNHNKNKNVINIKINTTEKTKRRRNGGGGAVKKPNQPPVFVSPVITVAPSYPQYPQYQPPVQTSVPLPTPSKVQAAEPVSVPVAEPRVVGGGIRDPHGFTSPVLRLHTTDDAIPNERIRVRDENDEIGISEKTKQTKKRFYENHTPSGDHSNVNIPHIASYVEEETEEKNDDHILPQIQPIAPRRVRPPLTEEQKQRYSLRRAEKRKQKRAYLESQKTNETDDGY